MNRVKNLSVTVSFAFIFALFAGLGSLSAADGPGISGIGSVQAERSMLHRIDTFPTCAEVRRCWRNSYGKRRCGLAVRCQTCKWVRRCQRGVGCAWREICTWGPYRPVLPTN